MNNKCPEPQNIFFYIFAPVQNVISINNPANKSFKVTLT